MRIWNGHGANPEFSIHICPKDTKILVWMVSRLGDVGITDNLVDTKGYDCRTEINNLYNWEITKIN